MKKTLCSLIVFAVLFCGARPENAQTKQKTYPVTKTITSNSAGAVKLGMTVAQMRRAVAPMKVKRTSDGEGVALIAVMHGTKTVMTVYAGEENPNAKINENARLEQIEVWDSSYTTARGLHPGMRLGDVEARLGKLVKIVRSEIEAREFAEFTHQPKGIEIRVVGNEEAGSYPNGESSTSKYRDDARVFSLLVTGRVDTQATSSAIRITFKENAISAQATGAFTSYQQRVEFVVRAEKGRRMIVNIIPISSGLATAGTVTGPSGQSDGQPGGIVFNEITDATGDYKIVVGPRPTEFDLPAQFIVEVVLLPEFLSR